MSRTIIGQSSSRSITVRNIGDLAATIRFACPSSQNKYFQFPSRGEDITLAPGVVERYSVFFQPAEIGEFTGKLIMSLQDNHYEDTVITLIGEGFEDAVAFEGVDEHTENRLTVGDCFVGEPRRKSFSVRSFAATWIRFRWNVPSSCIQIVPPIGHISPGATRAFEAVFSSSAPTTDSAKCTLSVESIQLEGEHYSADWDSTATITKWVPDDTVLAANDRENEDLGDVLRPALKKLVESVPEPKNRVTATVKTMKDLVVAYACDYTSFEIVLPDDVVSKSTDITKSIDFATTKLFQQRSVTFAVKNTGKVQLPFAFNVLSTDRTTLEDSVASIFTVSPARGTVPPGQLQEVTVIFRPTDVGDFAQLLIGSFPFGAKQEYALPLTGSSECPLVHFELPQTSYLSTRTEGEIASVDPNSGVIQFHSRGIKIRNTMKFMVLNPSNMSYDFEWQDVTPPSLSGPSPFRCNTTRGTIHSGKKLEMSFDFTPDSLKLREGLWNFNIIGKATIPFLLVGQASEPEVYFSQNKLQFGQVIVGGKSRQTVTIENRETIPYPFAFEKLPANASVTFQPMNGVIGPNSSVPVDITFSPAAEEAYNYMLVCRVRKVIAPLTVNVKGEGYTTRDSLRVQAPDGATVQLSPSQPNVISLGAVQVNGKLMRKFILTNQGRFNLDYRWTMAPHPSISMTQMIGTVTPNADSVVEFTYAPSKEESLQNIKLQCKVTNGNTYNITLNATSMNPSIAASWKTYDFGALFIQSASNAPPATATLTLTNKDKSLVAVDALFDNKEYLEIDVSSFVIPPGEKRDVRIQFTPKDVTVYSETLNFLLNGLTTISTVVNGEGVAPRVDILTRTVRFGTLRVGEKREIDVKLQCKSKILTPVSLEGCIPPELEKIGLQVTPDSTVFLKPKETKSVIFTFRPPLRMGPFSHDLQMAVCGQLQPFVTVSGSCHGAEVHVDSKTINFGTVVAGTKVTKRVLIMNTGDLNLSFNWNERKLANEFAMIPASGVIAAHTDQACELIYQPTEPGRDAKRDIEVRFDEAPSLAITVQGHSVERPPLTATVPFSCRVRETNTQKISLKNDSADLWTLRPAIDNNVWSAPETVTVRAKESADYPITYAPQTCTKNRSNAAPDIGTLFFPLPNGQALLYRLEGTADPPSVAAPPIEREVTAKVQHIEKLEVTNWLKVPQKFSVKMEWSNDPQDDSIVIKGVPSIDVPPNASREYKLSFLAYKEGRVTGTVHFTNEETSEYQFFNLAFTVKTAKETATIALSTQVRQRAIYEVTLTNPLTKSISMMAKAENPDLTVPPTVAIAPKSAVKVPIEFFPLVAKEHPPSKLLFQCSELGEFPFTVTLSALPPGQEKATRVNCALGQSVSATLRFQHYSKIPVDFTFKFSDPKQSSFFKSNGQMVIKANACADPRIGQEVSTDVTFEPSRLGDFRELVEISSPAAGTYAFPLFGTCTFPQRQGPFEIRPNQTTQISFKNVFSENITFNFSTDSPQFVLAKTSELIQGKKATAIAVQYRCEDPNAVARGKLTISATSVADNCLVQWVFYLRGMKESEVPTSPSPPVAPKKGK